MLSCLFTVATPYYVILCNFRLLFYLIYISVNSWYLNKPDEDWYWPVEISQLNSISHCLISPCKSLLDCNVFVLIAIQSTLPGPTSTTPIRGCVRGWTQFFNIVLFAGKRFLLSLKASQLSRRIRVQTLATQFKFRAFPKRVAPRIISRESVDYFRTSEHYWVVKKKTWIFKLAKLRW